MVKAPATAAPTRASATANGSDPSHINPGLQALAVDIDSLKPDPRNSRKHPEASLLALMESLNLYGQQRPIVVDDGIVIAGNGLWESARRLKWKRIAALPFDRGAALAYGYKVVDNRSAELSEWDHQILQEQIDYLKKNGQDAIAKLSWTEEAFDQVVQLAKSFGEAAGEQAADPSDGTLLDQLSVTLAEPKTKLEHGQMVKLGSSMLVIADPVNEVSIWFPHLNINDIFAPFPGIYAALSLKASGNRVLMVQPDLYIAGHIVDRWNELNGKGNDPAPKRNAKAKR